MSSRSPIARVCLVLLLTALFAAALLSWLPPVEAGPATFAEPATWTPGPLVTSQATASAGSRIFLPLVASGAP